MRRWPPKSLAVGCGIARTIEEDQGGATPPLWYRLKAGAEVFPSVGGSSGLPSTL